MSVNSLLAIAVAGFFIWQHLQERRARTQPHVRKTSEKPADLPLGTTTGTDSSVKYAEYGSGSEKPSKLERTAPRRDIEGERRKTRSARSDEWSGPGRPDCAPDLTSGPIAAPKKTAELAPQSNADKRPMERGTARPPSTPNVPKAASASGQRKDPAGLDARPRSGSRQPDSFMKAVRQEAAGLDAVKEDQPTVEHCDMKGAGERDRTTDSKNGTRVPKGDDRMTARTPLVDHPISQAVPAGGEKAFKPAPKIDKGGRVAERAGPWEQDALGESASGGRIEAAAAELSAAPTAPSKPTDKKHSADAATNPVATPTARLHEQRACDRRRGDADIQSSLVDSASGPPKVTPEPWQDAHARPSSADDGAKTTSSERRRRLEIAKAERRSARLSAVVDRPVEVNPVESHTLEREHERRAKWIDAGAQRQKETPVSADIDSRRELELRKAEKRRRMAESLQAAERSHEAAKDAKQRSSPRLDKPKVGSSGGLRQAASVATQPIGMFGPSQDGMADMKGVRGSAAKGVTEAPGVNSRVSSESMRRKSVGTSGAAATASDLRISLDKTGSSLGEDHDGVKDVEMARQALTPIVESGPRERRSSSVGSFGIITFDSGASTSMSRSTTALKLPTSDEIEVDPGVGAQLHSGLDVMAKEQESNLRPPKGSADTSGATEMTSAERRTRQAGSEGEAERRGFGQPGGQLSEDQRTARHRRHQETGTGGTSAKVMEPKRTRSTRPDTLPAEGVKERMRLEDVTPEDMERYLKAKELRKLARSKAEKAALGQGNSGMSVEEKESLASP